MRNKDMRAQGSLASSLLWQGVHQYTHLRSRWASRLSTSTSPSQPQLYNLHSTASQPELRSLVIPTLHLVRSHLLVGLGNSNHDHPPTTPLAKLPKLEVPRSRPPSGKEGSPFSSSFPMNSRLGYGITSRRKSG